MITIFTIPKAFEGETKQHQLNALRSWRQSIEGAQIFLCGDEKGIDEAAEECGATVLNVIEKNEYGTPLLSSAFREASSHSEYDTLCYVNSDIIIGRGMAELLKTIKWKQYLYLSLRRDIQTVKSIDFANPNWSDCMPDDDGRWKSREPTGLDLMIFPNDPVFTNIPKFAVGRPYWDNWFVYNIWRQNIPIVDATDLLKNWHPKHDYGHVKNSRKGWFGPEGDENAILAGDCSCFTIKDATHVLDSNGNLNAARKGVYLDKRVERLREFRPSLFKRLRSWRLINWLCILNVSIAVPPLNQDISK